MLCRNLMFYILLDDAFCWPIPILHLAHLSIKTSSSVQYFDGERGCITVTSNHTAIHWCCFTVKDTKAFLLHSILRLSTTFWRIHCSMAVFNYYTQHYMYSSDILSMTCVSGPNIVICTKYNSERMKAIGSSSKVHHSDIFPIS